MTYTLFSHLYSEALEYTDCDMYIAERVEQERMDAYNDAVLDTQQMLTKIWDIAHMDIKLLRSLLGLSRSTFSKIYTIPTRTIEQWDAKKRRPPEYITKLIAYTVFIDYQLQNMDRTKNPPT